MSALCWNKKLMLLKRIPRLVAYVVIPILVLVVFHLMRVEPMSFGFAYVVVTAFLLCMTIFSIEDLVFSEAILATPMSLKRLWLSTYMVNVIFTLTVPLVLFVIYTLLFHIGEIAVFFCSAVFGALLSAALQLLGLTHFSDYSFKKQLIAGVGVLLNLLAVVALFASIMLTPDNSIFYLPIDRVLFFAGTALFSLIIFAISFVVFGDGDPERLFINVNSLTRATMRRGNSGLVIE